MVEQNLPPGDRNVVDPAALPPAVRSELEKWALLKSLQGKPLWTKGRAPAALSPTERGLELMKRSLTDAYSTTGK